MWYLHVGSTFHKILPYSDIDRSSICIQEHSRHRYCKDCFHKETEKQTNQLINEKECFVNTNDSNYIYELCLTHGL